MPVPDAPCPICGKPTEPRLRPFCSKRCADVDLGRWITGQYVVPGPEDEAPGGAALDHGQGVG
jgi:endogenous inhibitor of DNA gyrase (YacG/DUF329 family)